MKRKHVEGFISLIAVLFWVQHAYQTGGFREVVIGAISIILTAVVFLGVSALLEMVPE